jgi:HTH-type transcriptional regulator, sugar sensing transcriptional regulator
MVASTEVLDALKSIGLNLYERKIFVALLAKGVATAAEVSEIANVPRSRSYDILESLSEKGFVMVQPSKPIKYVSLAPREAMERTKQSLKRKHDEMIERIDKLKESEVIKEMDSIYKNGLNLVQPTEMTGTLKGKYVIDRQLKSAFKDATKTIEIMTTEQGLNDLYSKHFRTLKKANRAGVKLKIAAPFGEDTLTKAFSQIAEIRKMARPQGRIAIIDGQNMLMALTDDKEVHETQDIALWASSSHAVNSMASPLFNHVWSKSK